MLTPLLFAVADFQENYNARGCQSGDNGTLGSRGEDQTVTDGYRSEAVLGDGGSSTLASTEVVVSECLRETSLLYLLLMLGTAWLGLSLYNFTKTYVS